MGFFRKVFGGGNPFKRVGGFLRDAGRDIKKTPNDLFGRGSAIGKGYRGISDLGNYGAAALGYETPGYKAKQQDKANEADANAAAAVRQAEFEASQREGLERLALKRKKGFGASMIVNPTMGSGSKLGS